ncbi:DEHA2D06314p [Debaryomyces hansenii CBS767]|uniref:DEHA2D06314p n=1 Tax=Debaryomyces hansenii (strain ATCC 36239 / CBS 767 / BCRC 21394 / JCM 1990 / NBRC 0083 / IGC 2968) TaxID=284592 RepID=Q6BST8_DEBHA|nr:DEHA2D06314p [Debaryomyces hansenii CBS767]CAG86876.1 DEHA2D06314p [Debaryomyces hansenii CBS767]|eukprot:XP_458732.1 DEHA2D06314p [Debaryomyces hansenii CBS767]
MSQIYSQEIPRKFPEKAGEARDSKRFLPGILLGFFSSEHGKYSKNRRRSLPKSLILLLYISYIYGIF